MSDSKKSSLVVVTRQNTKRVTQPHSLMRLTAICIMLLILITPVVATEYHTTLLTVAENGESWEGGTADLFLELRQGSGRVFIDSFPISRVDTQFSTRYAKEVACDFLETDCDNYDFFYTIRAGSSIVGGPSAGAAIAVLTIAALDKQFIKQDVAMTGTINSGSLIGPVSGIIPKITAAKDAGISVVVIPALAPLGVEELRMNSSYNLTNASINYSQAYDEEVLTGFHKDDFVVVQAGDLYEALPYFIEKEYPEPEFSFAPSDEYTSVMREVAQDLCQRRGRMLAEASDFLANESVRNRSDGVEEQIRLANKQERYYAMASFCFGHNIDLQRLLLSEREGSYLRALLRETKEDARTFTRDLELRNISTIGDLETYAIVRERLSEAEEILNDIDRDNISVNDLAYAVERFSSSEIWASFFGMDSSTYVINREHLHDACLNRLSEAEERVAYVENYLPARLTIEGRKELNLAREDYAANEYALCLFKASKAKAEANILSSALSITEPRLESLITRKMRAVERVLSRQAEQGLFPIMGYSYYEYGKSLQENDPYSTLTYAEYSLALSELHLYFPKEDAHEFNFDFWPWAETVFFFFGLVTGLVVFPLLFMKSKKKMRKENKKTSKKK